jgi:hypothetical protein
MKVPVYRLEPVGAEEGRLVELTQRLSGNPSAELSGRGRGTAESAPRPPDQATGRAAIATPRGPPGCLFEESVARLDARRIRMNVPCARARLGILATS